MIRYKILVGGDEEMGEILLPETLTDTELVALEVMLTSVYNRLTVLYNMVP